MILEIESSQNLHYKKLKKIVKEQKDFIVIEGKKLLKEAVDSSLELEGIYVDKKNKHIILEIIGNNNNVKSIFVSNNLLREVYTTDSKPTGNELVIALARIPTYEIDKLLSSKKDLIFLEQVQDPGNIGTIIRSALAFSFGGLILSQGSVSPYNTKVIRASAGALFKFPVCSVSNLDDFLKVVKQKNYEIVAVSPDGKSDFSCLNKSLSILFMFGSEGSGLSEKTLRYSDFNIKIPSSGKIESLNVNVAASIILWERYKFRS